MALSGVGSVVRWVLASVRGTRGSVLVALALVGGALSAVLAPAVLGLGFDWALSHPDWGWRAAVAGLAYGALWWLGQSAHGLVLPWYGRVEQRAQSKLMVCAANRSHAADPRARRRQDSGTIGFAIDALAASFRDGLSSLYLSLLPALVSMLAGVLAVGFIGGLAAVVVFVGTFSCYWFISGPLIRRHEAHQRLFFAAALRSYTFLVNSLALWREVRVYGVSHYLAARYELNRSRVERRALRSYRATRSMQLCQSGVLGAGLVALLWSETAADQAPSVGGVIALVGVFLSSAAPLQDAGFSLSTLAVAAARRQEAEATIQPPSSGGDSTIELPSGQGRPIWCLGASGAGKTTLVEQFLGLRELADDSLARHPDLRAGYLPHEPSLLAATVAENVRFGRAISDDDVDELLNRVGLPSFARGGSREHEVISPEESGLSVGEARRVALARALADPEETFVVLDEPTAGMDAQVRALVWRLIEEHAKTRTLVVATHDADAPILADDPRVTVG